MVRPKAGSELGNGIVETALVHFPLLFSGGFLTTHGEEREHKDEA